jgi:hypothetical protein
VSFLPQPITLQSVFGKKRLIGTITVQVIISEETSDALIITKQPVQTGASITDHSYKEPTALTMRILQQDLSVSAIASTFSGNGLSAIYQKFLDLQSSREPFNVITPKRIYKNMLVASIRLNTDKLTENILSLEIGLQQVILVTIGVATIPPSNQRNKKSTQANQSLGKKSALLTGAQGVGIDSAGFSR